MKRTPPTAGALICGCLLATACAPNLAYGPPPQKIMPPGADPPLVRPLVHMHDPDAAAFILQDIRRADNGGAQFRWTAAHPRLALWPDELEGRELYLRFGIHPATFKATGPVTIAIAVNGRPLAAPKFDAAGDYDYARPVPRDLLAAASPVIVDLDISPVYISPPWGEKLGIVLYTAGFREAR